MDRINPYSSGLEKNAANFVALSPLSFIERTARIYPQRTAIIYGEKQQSWADTYTRCRQLASALSKRGIGVGDTVAVMLPNVPAMLEAHFGIPMTGAVLNTLNTRLDAEAIAFMLRHGEAKVLLTDREFAKVVARPWPCWVPMRRWWSRWKTTKRPPGNTWASSATKACWPRATLRLPGTARLTSGMPLP
jgi:fatty-acyl-CoA synthase